MLKLSTEESRTENNNINPIINVGDKVRSYDFRSHKDCYVEGIVESIEGHPLGGGTDAKIYLKFLITRKVFNGKEILDHDTIGEYNWVPQNGVPVAMSDRLTNEVELIKPFLNSESDLIFEISESDLYVKMYDFDGNGRAQWTMYSEERPAIRFAEGQINLVTNWAHVHQSQGIVQLFNVDDVEVDVDTVLVDLIENRSIRVTNA
jgi:hypothetical protein